MNQARRSLCLLVLTAVGALTLLPRPALAQSGTVTDDAFASSSATTQLLNLKGQGVSLIVAGSSATVASVPVGLASHISNSSCNLHCRPTRPQQTSRK